jgi:four helix bundle protein
VNGERLAGKEAAMGDKPHKKLDAWRKAIDLTVQIYQVTEKMPEEERFGLTAQMRRSAVSVPSNIAEGAAKRTKKEFVQYLHIARGSLSEFDTQVIICRELGYFSDTDLNVLTTEIERESKLGSGLIRFLAKR